MWYGEEENFHFLRIVEVSVCVTYYLLWPRLIPIVFDFRETQSNRETLMHHVCVTSGNLSSFPIRYTVREATCLVAFVGPGERIVLIMRIYQARLHPTRLFA